MLKNCQKITADGSQCKRKAQKRSKFCWQHKSKTSNQRGGGLTPEQEKDLNILLEKKYSNITLTPGEEEFLQALQRLKELAPQPAPQQQYQPAPQQQYQPAPQQYQPAPQQQYQPAPQQQQQQQQQYQPAPQQQYQPTPQQQYQPAPQQQYQLAPQPYQKMPLTNEELQEIMTRYKLCKCKGNFASFLEGAKSIARTGVEALQAAPAMIQQAEHVASEAQRVAQIIKKKN